uniref:Uncharacterized protein n=1 Tax=Anguilla anguilla TaxID=7936 RepID=A0A0E9TZU0_ANGAN
MLLSTRDMKYAKPWGKTAGETVLPFSDNVVVNPTHRDRA